MASHVPFLAVRPDAQFSIDVKTRDFASSNGILSDISKMDPVADSELSRVPPASRLPSAIRFPLVCLLSYSLSTLLYSLVAGWVGVELAAVSRELSDEWQIGSLIGWKFIELCVAWYAGYDWQDIAGLACLSNLPYYFLLHTFYSIDLVACVTALSIDVATIALPFALLRPLIHAHEPGKGPNQQVAQDPSIFFQVALFGSAIYAVVVYSSLYTWLPAHIVTHFDYVRSMERAHNASVPLLLVMLVPVGWATAQFLFTPAIGTRGNPGITDPELNPQKLIVFDPENATFGETLAYNLGWGKEGFTKRAEVLAKRTAVLIACSLTNTFVRVLLTIDGTEAVGALGWASVWGLAAALTSLAYAWLSNE